MHQGSSGSQLSALISFCIKHTLSVVCYQLLAEMEQLGQGKTATAHMNYSDWLIDQGTCCKS